MNKRNEDTVQSLSLSTWEHIKFACDNMHSALKSIERAELEIESVLYLLDKDSLGD